MTTELAQESRLQQIAALSLQNTPEYKIAEALGISRRQVKKIRSSTAFKDALKEMADEATAVALHSFRAKMEELGELAYAALKRNLEEGRIEAVKTWAEMVGAKDRREEKQQDTTLTIVMPGAAPVPPTIEVLSEVVSADESERS